MVLLLFPYLKKLVRQWISIFRKKQPNIKERNQEEIRQLLDNKQLITFVSSFPRSGNTWLRFLLSDLLLQNMQTKTSTELPIHPDKIIPDIYANLISECDSSICRPGFFVKTHESFEVLYRLFASIPRRCSQHVYIYRDPGDALVSYYHFHQRYEHLRSKAIDGIDAFCLAHLPDWISHVTSYLSASENGELVFPIAYESLLQDPIAILHDLLDFLNINAEKVMLRRAVANMEFGNLRDQEAINPLNENNFFFRNGKKGSASRELQTKTLHEIRKNTAHIIEQMGALTPNKTIMN